MAINKPGDSPSKFIREFHSFNPETGTTKLDARWHYDLEKFPNGPILAEDLNPMKESKPEKTKKKRKT